MEKKNLRRIILSVMIERTKKYNASLGEEDLYDCTSDIFGKTKIDAR